MQAARTDVYQFQAALSSRLMAWAAASVGGGLMGILLNSRSWRGFGIQSAVWGLIDGVIGYIGARGAVEKASHPENHTATQQGEESAKLRRVLWVNTGLDVVYVLGGLVLARTQGCKDAFARGTGWGIVVQGGFLLGFDLFHALHLSGKR
ncbi:MAG: hypothetical protein JW892_17675 [Anaerolineae bacterium]|nr:hypothetical protein [Anaerolineae bacterium]